MTTQRRPKLTARYWPKVDVRGLNECWPWIGNTKNGYGVIRAGAARAGTLYAHRIGFELTNGPIPEEMTIDHICVNTLCQNPAHLQAISRAENSGLAKRRWTHCVNGHEFTEANTYWRKEGRRSCRACHNERRRRR